MRAIDYFDKSAELHPDRTAIMEGDTRYSYGETRTFSERIARAMLASGSRSEQHAAIFSQNHPAVLFCMLGILRVGAAWVPINFRNAADANVKFLNYSETAWLFYHSRFREQVEEVRKRVPSLKHLVCIDSTDSGHPSLADFMEIGNAGAVNVSNLASNLDRNDAHGNLDQIMGLVPTGGTTGPARGVRVTNLAWGTMTEMATHYWKGDTADPVCLCTAPLSHAAGVVAFTMFALSGTNVVLPGFDALQVLQAIERHRVTHLFLPPTAFYALLAHPDVGKFDYSSLRVFLLAGSPVSPDKLKKGVEVFGPCMCQSYGQTEAPMLLTFLDARTVAEAAAGDHPERLRSCGRPTTAVRLAIMDDAGQILPPNQPGEIVARGTLVTAGYHNLPRATAEIRSHGWHLHHYMLTLDTGDVPEGEHLVPFGVADIKRAGSDVTIVATGWMVKKSLAAAEQLEREGISAEVIDPRTLAPLDVGTIVKSVKKTGRLVLVDQAPRQSSAAAVISVEVAEKGFEHLRAPIVMVTALDASVPYSEPLESYLLPNEEKIADAVRSVVPERVRARA